MYTSCSTLIVLSLLHLSSVASAVRHTGNRRIPLVRLSVVLLHFVSWLSIWNIATKLHANTCTKLDETMCHDQEGNVLLSGFLSYPGEGVGGGRGGGRGSVAFLW